MRKVIVDKEKCREVALLMKDFSFKHPETKRDFQDLEKELFYLFTVVGICHQINWNFLMKALKDIQENYPSKFTPQYMQEISDKEIYDWLSAYPKKWRLEKRFKRGELVRDMCGVLTHKYEGRVENVLRTSENKMGGKNGLYTLLKNFQAYGEDPLCKKSAVFIDLIDRFGLWEFSDWDNYIPPIDYQITRIALRNGVVEVKDPELLKKLENNASVTQEEDTVIRSAVIDALAEMTKISNRHSKDLQGFYWALGRECCDSDNPRCVFCETSNCSVSAYMNINCGSRCPLVNVCKAAKNKELLKIREQNFETTFY
ncbi:hypothetical protein KJA15_02410 [Patescibacteria group bacterium]|nr:hypothetical protein [Patescibacteria group bacterium]